MSMKKIHETLDPSRITYADAAKHVSLPLPTCPNHSTLSNSSIVKIRPHDPFEKMRTKLERDYANHLEWKRKAGLIGSWHYELCMFRITPTVTYSPDFAVVNGDTLTFYETKGYWTQDGLIKFRLARDTLPFRFVAVKRVKGEWIETENPVREERRGERLKRKAGG